MSNISFPCSTAFNILYRSIRTSLSIDKWIITFLPTPRCSETIYSSHLITKLLLQGKLEQTWIHKAKNRELSWRLRYNSSLFQSKPLFTFPGDVVGISSLFKIITGTVKLSQGKQKFTHFAFTVNIWMQQGVLAGLISNSLSPPQRTWCPKMSSCWSLHLKNNHITRPIFLYRKTCSSQMSTLVVFWKDLHLGKLKISIFTPWKA